MSSLVNMARTNREINEEKEGMSFSPRRFPGGLTLHLDDESLTKLEIKDMPAVGGRVKLGALASIAEVRAILEGDGKDRSLTLQIEELALEESDPDEVARAEVLFGEGTQNS